MKTNEQIQELVIQWADERGINNPVRQKIKFGEEYGELCGDYLDGKDLTDDIGDTAITLIILQKLKHSNALRFSDKYSKRSNIDSSLVLVTECVEWGEEYQINALGNFAVSAGYDFNVCLNHAWNEIKDRKGKTVNGSFIREDVR